MDLKTGLIRELNPGSVEQLQAQLKEKEVLINQKEKEILEQYKPEERTIIFHGLRSKNNSAKRRALKKIAKISRRRNRK